MIVFLSGLSAELLYHVNFFPLQDVKNKGVEHVLILSGDHLYRMDYMDFVQVNK